MTRTTTNFAKAAAFALLFILGWQILVFGQSKQSEQAGGKTRDAVLPPPVKSAVVKKEKTLEPPPAEMPTAQETPSSPKAERQRVAAEPKNIPTTEAPRNTPYHGSENGSTLPRVGYPQTDYVREGEKVMRDFELQQQQWDAEAQRQIEAVQQEQTFADAQRRQMSEQFQEQQVRQQQATEERQRQNEAERQREDETIGKVKTEAAKWSWIPSLVELFIFAGLFLIALRTGHARKSAKAMLIGAAIQLPMVICGLILFGTLNFGVEPFIMLGGGNTLTKPDVSLSIVALMSFLFGVLGVYLYVGAKISTVISLCLAPKNTALRLLTIFCAGICYTAVYLILARFSPVEYFGAATGIVILFLGSIIALTKSGKAQEGAFHGSARFAERRELKEFEKPLEAGGFVLAPAHPEGNHGKLVLPRNLSVMHGLILGGSGTGKSRGYFMANCAEARHTSLVVTDPKSELWKYTSGFHDKAMRFAPVEPDASFCFNWIPLCLDARMAELCARAIMTAGSTKNTDQFWIDAETAFLSAVFAHAATTEFPTPMTAYRLFTRQKPEDLLEQLEHSPSAAAREQAVIFKQTDARIKGAIVPAIAARMQFMRDPNIQVFTSAHTDAPDFGALRRNPTAVYWCLREQDITRLRPLTSLFFTVMLEQIAGEQILEGESETPITMFLDEFANIGAIPDFETIISLARGRGVGIWLGVQSLSQLSKAYGQDNAQTIMSNCTTKIALHGLDYQTAEYVSKTLGEQTVSHNRTGFGFGMNGVSMNTGAAQHRRQLLTADEVMRIGEAEAIVRTSNKYPMRVYKGYYDEQPRTAPMTQTLLQIQAADIGAEEEVLAV